MSQHILTSISSNCFILFEKIGRTIILTHTPMLFVLIFYKKCLVGGCYGKDLRLVDQLTLQSVLVLFSLNLVQHNSAAPCRNLNGWSSGEFFHFLFYNISDIRSS